MLISPWVAKGAVFQEPACSAQAAANGSCAGGAAAGAQFEHSSIPGTVKAGLDEGILSFSLPHSRLYG